MKKIVIGAILSAYGLILFFIVNQNILLELENIHSWSIYLGKHLTAITNVYCGIPFFISVILFFIGIFLLLKEAFKSDKE